MVTITENVLLEGDALNPSSTDLIIQKGRLPVGQPVPNGWRVMTGNATTSLVIRPAYRYELED
jgi:hypothetical protein